MRIIDKVLRFALKPTARSFEESTKDPAMAQANLLSEFLTRNKDTAYGREMAFGEIRNARDYQSKLPIGNYEHFRPYVERLMRGERRILTKEEPILFGTTSGTTGAPKFIPVTKYSRKKKIDVMNIWIYHMLKDHPGLLDGKILAVVSPEKEDTTERGLPCGAETGHAYKNLPYAIRCFYVLPYPVLEIKDYPSKYYCILRLAMEKEITAIATMNPSTITLLCHKIGIFANDIIVDIERGTLKKELKIKDETRKVIEKGLKPNPSRAAFLRNTLRDKEQILPSDLWPTLKLIQCWKAGTVGHYLKDFPKYFGGVKVRDFGYLSSEARCSIPMDDDKCCGVLAINSNFYEFIPREERLKGSNKTLLCDELELGKEYFVMLTTPGGLYRYDIDDVVKVTGFKNKTPRIEFVQKGLNVTSLTGEKLYESHVSEAVKKVIDRIKVEVEFITGCIECGDSPRYVFLVEFKDAPDHDKKKSFLRALDDEIKVINVEYESKRNSERLHDPVMRIVKKGAFLKYRTNRVRNGTHDGQFKVAQLTNDVCFQDNFAVEEEIGLK